MLDHLHEPVEHRLERLILRHHLQSFPSMLFQPFVPFPLADIPRDALETRGHTVLVLHPYADFNVGPAAAAGEQLEFQRSCTAALQV